MNEPVTDAPTDVRTDVQPDDRSTRVRRLALLGVLALLAAAVAYGTRGDDATGAAPAPTGPSGVRLAELRDAAGLAPCPPGLGPDVPDLVLPCLDGGDAVDLTAAPPGRPTVVNVWASWCGPCVREVPLLADFAERAGGQLALVGVLTQDSLESALTFAQASGMTWPSVVDDDGVVMRAYSPGPPVTLFITADGELAHVERGEFTSLAELEALAAEHLDVQL